MKNSRKVFFSYLFTNLGLTKLVELNKILRYRKKNNTVKDREKEEYTSELYREKDSLAEKSFVERMCFVEGDFRRNFWVGKAGRSRYRR